MKYKIEGKVMQILNIELEEEEEVYAEAGAMVWMSDNIAMNSFMKGGILGGVGRVLTGESLFLVKFTPTSGKGIVSFAPSSPGRILDIEVGSGKEYICQKDAFLVAENSIELKTIFRKKLGAGLFGGEGFILQKLIGKGQAFVEIDGEVFEMNLKEGEKIKVDTGSIALFESSVKYDIEMVKSIKNMLFGGEGVFLATLEGPGKVWLQSMPLKNLAGRIAAVISKKG